MGDEFPLANALADKGFLPQPYGTRTILEYASRLIDVPPLPPPPVAPGEVIDVDDPTSNNINTSKEHELQQCMKALEGAYPENSFMRAVEQQLLLTATPVPSAGYANKYVRPPNGNTNTIIDENAGILANVKNVLSFALSKSTGGDLSLNYQEPANQALAWHCRDARLATISTNGQQISVNNTADCTWATTDFPAHKGISNIRAIAWRPCAANTIAVGCDMGVALYSFNINSNNNIKYLRHEGHTSCTRLTWNSDGSKLASASPHDFSVRLWDVASGTSVRVCTDGSVISFSPNIADLLVVANALKASFRFWSTDTWEGERWNLLSGVPTAVAWHPKSTHFALASRGDSCVHFFKLKIDQSAASIVHSEITSLPKLGPGGIPRALAWDNTGERFAVIFHHDQHQGAFEDFQVDTNRRFLVALYNTSTNPNFTIAPIGYVAGPPKSGPPLDIQFKCRGGIKATSVLAVAWACGDITFTQMFFQAM